jgi:citronellyl-CoA dehydrogenase
LPDLVPVTQRTSATGYRERAERALAAVPSDAPAPAVWRALGAAGALAGLYPGSGPLGPVIDPERLGVLLRTVDDRADNGVTLGVLVQTASALPVLGSGAAPRPSAAPSPVTDAYEAALAGTAQVALAATDEAVPGSDLTGLGTELRTEGDELVVHGGKRWVTNACSADHLLVLARRRPGRHFTNFSWILVPATAPGVTVRQADSDLLANASTGHITFDSVRLPARHLVGRNGRGMVVFARHMSTERLAGALWAVALTSRVLADTRARLRERIVDGEPLWHNAAVRQSFAVCLVRVAQLRALCETLAEEAVTGQNLSAGALLKSAVGLTADSVLARCAQLQGADGMAAGGAQRIRAEAGVLGIGGGVTELMLANVADASESILDGLRT